MPYANNKGADQPAHPRSLISTFVVHCLDSVICILAKAKISRLWLFSEAEQASLSVTWSDTPEDRFSRDVAHMISEVSQVFYLNLGTPEQSREMYSLIKKLVRGKK